MQKNCLLFLLISNTLFSQSRIVFSNNPYLVIENNAQLVIQNSSPDAITLLGTGGNIISEAEGNKVKWNIGTSSGNYSVPFTKSPGNKIPFSLNIINSGVANGSILFSTYGGSTWDNSTYLPSDVTSITSVCCPNNSANVIDRFWIVDAINYTTKPEVELTFTYLDGEHSAISNTINESNLFAQRFNPNPINDWGDWYGSFGTANITANTVTSGSISSSNFFKSWTLVDQNAPLPIELLYFKAECLSDNSSLFEWATATEKNNRYFTIEKSSDGLNWSIISKILSKGNSSTKQTYRFTENINDKNTSLTYYRLKQTDEDGKSSYSKIETLECRNTIFQVNEFPNPNNGVFTINLSGFDGEKNNIEISISNVIGELIEQRTIYVKEQIHSEFFNLTNHPHGIYFLSINNSNNLIVKKIIHQ